MLAAVRSATLFGVEGRPVTVEVHVAASACPAFQIVGLPDEACRESRDRVRAAVLSSGLALAEQPRSRSTSRRRSERKGGSGLDLAIAVGVLAASEQVPPESMAGLRRSSASSGSTARLRTVPGIAPMVGGLRPAAGPVRAAPAQLPRGAGRGRRRCAGRRRTLREVVDALNGDAPWPRPPDDELVDDEPPGARPGRRARPAAAPGWRWRSPPQAGTTCCWSGRPGSGKTMLAQRLPGLLPPLEPARVAGDHDGPLGRRGAAAGRRAGAPPAVPCAAPQQLDGVAGGWRQHHAPARRDLARPRWRPVPRRARRVRPGGARRAAPAAGGGRHPAGPGPRQRPRCRPGSCWSRPPTRARAAAERPGECECDDGARLRYLRRLSGPLLDRFDLRVGVERPDVDDLLASGGGEPTRRGRRPGGGRAPARARPHRHAQRRHPGVAARRAGPAPSDAAAGDAARAARGATGSPGAATTASAAWPAPSPTCDGESRAGRSTTHVALALQLRVSSAGRRRGRQAA